MSALTHSATEAVLALCQDACGKMTGGQEARAFAYLKLAISALTAENESSDSRGDVRGEKALKIAIDSLPQCFPTYARPHTSADMWHQGHDVVREIRDPRGPNPMSEAVRSYRKIRCCHG